jgi:hypothetical protein
MIRKYCALLVASFAMIAGLVVMTPATTHAACNTRFLTFPTWYNGLTDGNCQINSPEKEGGIQKFILKIALNFLDIMFQAVAYITVGYILWGGFKYVTSFGESSDIVLARQRILNAIIGLVIAMVAAGIVNYVGSILK